MNKKIIYRSISDEENMHKNDEFVAVLVRALKLKMQNPESFFVELGGIGLFQVSYCGVDLTVEKIDEHKRID